MWTTIEGFQGLEKAEIELLLEAPALITILIGGADGELDSEERHWSERLLRSRTYNNPKVLNDYYRVVVETFWVRMQSEMAHLPREVEERNREISARLAQLNPVLARLDRRLAADLYKGFVGLAEETAKSSGGFLRIGAIGTEENEWIKLPMLEPVVAPPPAPEPEEDVEGD